MNYKLDEQMVAPLYRAHSTAWIDERAEIGEGTTIWMNAQIREHAQIGKNCVIAKDVYIDQFVEIGHGCKIQNSSSIYYGVKIEELVFIGPHVAFTNDRIPRAFSKGWLASPTLVSRGASIGANATIRCGINIGEYSMVGAGSVVTKDVEPYSMVVGNPARHVCYVNEDGTRLDKDGAPMSDGDIDILNESGDLSCLELDK